MPRANYDLAIQTRESVANAQPQSTEAQATSAKQSEYEAEIDCNKFRFLPTLRFILHQLAEPDAANLISAQMIGLRNQFQAARSYIDSLPGVELTREEQRERYHQMSDRLNKRRENISRVLRAPPVGSSSSNPAAVATDADKGTGNG